MTRLVSFSAQALRDIELAVRHYRRAAGERVGADFLRELERLSALISSSPGIGRLTGRADNFVLMLSGFPYQVFYRRVDDRELRVLRIRHARRRPLNP